MPTVGRSLCNPLKGTVAAAMEGFLFGIPAIAFRRLRWRRRPAALAPVVHGFKGITQGPAVDRGTDLNQAALAHQGLQPLDRVPAEVTNTLVHRPESAGIRGHRDDQMPTGADEAKPIQKCCAVILDVLEHLEGTDQVIALAWIKFARRCLLHLATVSGNAFGGNGIGLGIRLEAEVCRPPGHPCAEGALAATDLEHRCRAQPVK